MILTCDPGLTGAFAAYDPVSSWLTVVDMPVFERSTSRGTRTAVDEGRVIELLRAWANMGAEELIIELVSGMPGQSAPAAFNFGYGVGVVRTAALSAGLAIREVAPLVWKRAMRLPSGPKKSAAVRAVAADLLPAWRHLWPLQKHDGRAEAALLAVYAEKHR